MNQPHLMGMLGVVCAAVLGCSASTPTPVQGIELEDPQQRANQGAIASAPSTAAAGVDPSAGSEFVYSRDPQQQRHEVPQLPIHINDSWWSFRAQYLNLSEEEAQRRDGRLSRARAPAAFWDSQTSVEAVSVWTVLCNECHGGRRSLQDALEMPEPAPAWGEGQGLFFGNRRGYSEMFDVVYKGGPIREDGRAKMPAWRGVLSTEMIWALLYFLEYQSGGIESRFPPSLYPRSQRVPGTP